MKTIEAAAGRWHGILTALGIGPACLDGKHGPCPLCGAGKDRFRWDNKDGSGSYFCSQCGAGTGMQLLMAFHGWGFPRAAIEVDAIIGNVSIDPISKTIPDADKVEYVRKLLKSSRKLQPNSPAWIYLNIRCGDPGDVCMDLRSHHKLKHSDDQGTWPGMLAVIRYPDGKGASLHRTFLTPEGQKAPVDPVRKIVSCLPLEGSSVRLGPVQERLGIAEGIETAICAGKLFGLPCWAAISADGMKKWEPPDGCKSVLVCGDNDASFTGQAAAYELARKLKLKGFDVDVVLPEIVGNDFCDVWVSRYNSNE